MHLAPPNICPAVEPQLFALRVSSNTDDGIYLLSSSNQVIRVSYV
jgi:hypothetical protein